ncbi:MAG: lycopene cyclase domain-containing protein [Nanoarchaeota archaeon]
MVFSSILFSPFALLHQLFVPEYWQPNVLVHIWDLFAIESLLFCFFTGGIAAIIYTEVFKIGQRKAKAGSHGRHHAYIVYALIILMIMILLLMKLFTEALILQSSLIIGCFILFYLLYSRHDLIKESLIGGILFLILYIITLVFVDILFPGFIENEWNLTGSLGRFLFSIPVEEYFYAMIFGMTWSIIYEEIYNIRLTKKHAFSR